MKSSIGCHHFSRRGYWSCGDVRNKSVCACGHVCVKNKFNKKKCVDIYHEDCRDFAALQHDLFI